MTQPRSSLRRRILAGLVPLLIAAGALPLLAPTCGSGGEGWKAFSRNSLIIPMDVCYQSQGDGSGRSHVYTPASCPGTQDPGNVIKAYGLVYQLIRNNIAVYWVIDQGKVALTDYDLSVQYNGGFPVLKYNWSTGLPGAAPATNADHTVRYRGGPFIIDGSDYDRAVQVLRSYQATFGPASGSGVNIHVSNVAFRGYAKKTMAGGWSAGGTIPPKLAMLDIGSGNITRVNADGTPSVISDPKNAQPVIGGYLAEAGIGSGAAVGSATGTHGEIYDKLGIEDFQPEAGSTDPHTSNLFKNGYQILWVPHWVAPGSCATPTSGSCLLTIYSEAKIAQVLRTIGVFVTEGGDLFGECASIGSFEGAFRRNNTGTGASSYTLDYQDGDPSTRFQTTLGVRYNELATSPFAAPSYPAGNFGSPLMQLGDYTFSPLTGAVEDYRPQDTTSYQPNTTRLITSSGSTANWDFFSVRPPISGDDRGTIVYLAGHSYSGDPGHRSRSPAPAWCSTRSSTWAAPAPPAASPATPASWASAAAASSSAWPTSSPASRPSSPRPRSATASTTTATAWSTTWTPPATTARPARRASGFAPPGCGAASSSPTAPTPCLPAPGRSSLPASSATASTTTATARPTRASSRTATTARPRRSTRTPGRRRASARRGARSAASGAGEPAPSAPARRPRARSPTRTARSSPGPRSARAPWTRTATAR